MIDSCEIIIGFDIDFLESTSEEIIKNLELAIKPIDDKVDLLYYFDKESPIVLIILELTGDLPLFSSIIHIITTTLGTDNIVYKNIKTFESERIELVTELIEMYEEMESWE